MIASERTARLERKTASSGCVKAPLRTSCLTVQGLEVQRAGRTLLSDVSFSLARGELLCVLGPSGAGKSTLFCALLGLISARGEVHFDGAPWLTRKPEERARHVAYVPQESGLRAGLRVGQVVAQGRFALGQAPRDVEQDEEVVREALALTDTQHLLTRTFPTLSGGEKRRVLIARALATEAKVLVLDEPTAGLDILHALELRELLHRLARKGYAVAMSEHDLDAARTHADRVLVLSSGKVVAHGPASDVLTAKTLEDVFGVRLLENQAARFVPSLPGVARW